MYVVSFPLTETEIKPRSLKMLCFSKRLNKSSETKQNLYIKFSKNKSAKAEGKYKNYKIFSKSLKQKSKEKLLCLSSKQI